MIPGLPPDQPAEEPKPRHSHGRKLVSRKIVAGTFLGLVWGASLRAWMVTLALQLGDRPVFTWQGTFVGILLPAALVGALTGRAIAIAETSGRGTAPWLLLSPLLLPLAAAMVLPDFLSVLLTTGMGGGAIGVALIGILGGFALSGFSSRWARGASGMLAILFAAGSVVPVYFGGPSSVFPPDAGTVFGITFFLSLMMLLVAGISAPFRASAGRRKGTLVPTSAA